MIGFIFQLIQRNQGGNRGHAVTLQCYHEGAISSNAYVFSFNALILRGQNDYWCRHEIALEL
jgi:hypothetical protein